VFSVPFQFLAAADLKLYQNGTLKTLSTHYTVTGAGASSGTVTLVSGAALSDDILIVRDMPVQRIGDFPVSGPFDVASLNDQLDAQTMMVRDMETRIDRRLLRQPVADLPETLSDIPAKVARANLYLGFDANGQPKAEMPNAAVITDYGARIGTLETISGGLSAVNTVATNIASVTAVATIDDKVVIAADNVADINNFADVYQGGKAANPALRNDGTALQTGDLYFNTTNDRMRVYETGTGWIDYEATAQTAATTATAQATTATTQAGIATTQAGIATSQATTATTQASLATTARTGAETARDAAFTNANVYATTAAGLAAVASGQQFQVVAGTQIVRYRNDTGVATEVARYPAASAITDVFSRVMGKVQAQGADVRGFWYADGPVNYYDSSGALTKWISVDPAARELGLGAVLYSGANPRPILQSRGVYFPPQTGFQVNSQVLPDTDNFCLVMAFELPVEDIVTYNTKADMTAVTTRPIGSVAKVINDTNTTQVPDVPNDLIGITDAWNPPWLVNGYYQFAAPFNDWQTSFNLLKMTGAANERVELSINQRGQLQFFFYDGSGGGDPVGDIYGDMWSRSGPQILCIHKEKSGALTLYVNGREVARYQSTQSLMTGLTSFFVGCFGLGVSSAYPTGLNGSRIWIKALSIVDNCDWMTMRDVHDSIADYAKAPTLEVPQESFGILYSGQSWWQGSVESSSDPWVNANNGWDGNVDSMGGTNTANVGKSSLITEPLYGVRSTRDNSNNREIGPFQVRVNAYGSVVGTEMRAPSNYNLSHAMMKHVISYANAQQVDWTFGSSGGGGFTLASLAAETSPPYLVQALKPLALASPATVYELLLQSVVWARDFHRERGQIYSLKAFLWQQGHSDMSNANYQAEFLAYYDKLNASIKRITGQSDDVICSFPQINFSSRGIGNRTNYVTGVIDQTMLDIVDNRGTRPLYCLGPVYQITNHIHSYNSGYRWQGEIFGKILKQIVWDGVNWQPLRPRSFTRGATYVDVTYYVPVGPMQFATNSNNVPSTVTFDGVNTYGFGFWSGTPVALTFTVATSIATLNAHGFANGTRVMFQTEGVLPTGLTAATPYFVVNATTNTFQLEATVGGGVITLSGTPSGTHYVYNVNKKITGVAIQNATTIRITLDAAPVAGDSVDYVGAFSRVGNLVDSDAATAFYHDQDWTVPFVSGSPPYKKGSLNDLRNWACGFKKVLA
jgi:hypothetical protein